MKTCADEDGRCRRRTCGIQVLKDHWKEWKWAEVGERHACEKQWIEASINVDGNNRREAWKFILNGLSFYLHGLFHLEASTRLPVEVEWKSSGCCHPFNQRRRGPGLYVVKYFIQNTFERLFAIFLVWSH